VGGDETETDSFSAGLNGVLPFTGLSYDLTGSLVGRDSLSGESFFGDSGIRLSQPLLRDFWIDQPRAQIQLNRKSLKISEWVLREQILVTVAAVEQAYFNLIFTRENVRVQTNALELAREFLRQNKRRVELGSLAPLEEKQAEAQVATIQAQVFEAERAAAAQENALKTLITDDFAAWHKVELLPAENLVAVPASFDVTESWRNSLTQRPEIQQLRLDLERRDITLRFQKNQLFPALDLVGSYGHNALNSSYNLVAEDLREGHNPRYSYGVVLNIPIGNRSARNRYRIGKAEKEQALLQYKQLEQRIMVQVDDAIKLAQSAFQRVEATREARLFAEAALDAEEKKLASGKGTTFIVLQFQRDLTEARFQEIRALAEYNNALSQVSLREGTTLERRRIQIDSK
jgi:outer membrane protein TolC